MGEESSEEGGGMSLAPRLLKTKLEDALTLKQEFEARVATMEEKLKKRDCELSDLKIRVIMSLRQDIRLYWQQFF